VGGATEKGKLRKSFVREERERKKVPLLFNAGSKKEGGPCVIGEDHRNKAK